MPTNATGTETGRGIECSGPPLPSFPTMAGLGKHLSADEGRELSLDRDRRPEFQLMIDDVTTNPSASTPSWSVAPVGSFATSSSSSSTSAGLR